MDRGVGEELQWAWPTVQSSPHHFPLPRRGAPGQVARTQLSARGPNHPAPPSHTVSQHHVPWPGPTPPPPALLAPSPPASGPQSFLPSLPCSGPPAPQYWAAPVLLGTTVLLTLASPHWNPLTPPAWGTAPPPWSSQGSHPTDSSPPGTSSPPNPSPPIPPACGPQPPPPQPTPGAPTPRPPGVPTSAPPTCPSPTDPRIPAASASRPHSRHAERAAPAGSGGQSGGAARRRRPPNKGARGRPAPRPPAGAHRPPRTERLPPRLERSCRPAPPRPDDSVAGRVAASPVPAREAAQGRRQGPAPAETRPSIVSVGDISRGSPRFPGSGRNSLVPRRLLPAPPAPGGRISPSAPGERVGSGRRPPTPRCEAEGSCWP